MQSHYQTSQTEKNKRVVFTTDVIESNGAVEDFIKCCSLFKNENFLFDNSVEESFFWKYPSISKKIVSNEANAAIVSLAFETICNFEKKFPGSGLIFLELYNNAMVHTSSRKIRGSSKFLLEAVKKILPCSTTSIVMQQVRKYGNPQLSISATRAPIVKPMIRFVSTPEVRLRIASGFSANSSKFSNCKFFMVDGAVSKSSELMRLLNASFEQKETTYFLVCKSFNEEVLNTLQENYIRNVTNVVPVEYGFDLESINSLADLQSIVGGLPYSAALGDVLSAADLNRCGKSDTVETTMDSLIIKPSQSNDLHIKYLTKKIDQATDAERKVISKRLISLKGNACRVQLPKESTYDNAEINIRHATVLLSQMTKFGVTEINIGKKKFYIPEPSYTIVNELATKVEEVLKTKIYLPRR